MEAISNGITLAPCVCDIACPSVLTAFRSQGVSAGPLPRGTTAASSPATQTSKRGVLSQGADDASPPAPARADASATTARRAERSTIIRKTVRMGTIYDPAPRLATSGVTLWLSERTRADEASLRHAPEGLGQELNVRALRRRHRRLQSCALASWPALSGAIRFKGVSQQVRAGAAMVSMVRSYPPRTSTLSRCTVGNLSGTDGRRADREAEGQRRRAITTSQKLPASNGRLRKAGIERNGPRRAGDLQALFYAQGCIH